MQRGQAGHLLSLSPTQAISAAQNPTANTSVFQLLPTTLFGSGGSAAGSLLTTGLDYRIASGYVDLYFDTSSGNPQSLYILEYILEPSEADSTTGLSDVSFILRKFLKKQMLGITLFTIPDALRVKYLRLKLSQVNVMGVAGYTYNIKVYSAMTTAAASLRYQIIGGKLKWDRIV